MLHSIRSWVVMDHVCVFFGVLRKNASIAHPTNQPHHQPHHTQKKTNNMSVIHLTKPSHFTINEILEITDANITIVDHRSRHASSSMVVPVVAVPVDDAITLPRHFSTDVDRRRGRSRRRRRIESRPAEMNSFRAGPVSVTSSSQ